MKERRELLDRAAALREQGRPFALAPVVKIDGSAYRRPGARMLVAPSGKGPPRRSAPSAADVSKVRGPGRRRP